MHAMPKKYSLNLKYFFFSLALLSLLSFNMFYYYSPIVGSLSLLTFVICNGLLMGDLVFSRERRISRLLFGVVLVICWIIVSEGMLVIFKI